MPNATLVKDVSELVAIAREMHNLPINDAVRAYKLMRDYKEFVENELKALTEAIDNSRQAILPALFNAAGVTSIAVDGYRFTITESLKASIAADKRTEAYAWLKAHDLGELVVETVWPSTLAAQARQMAEDGTELDQDLFKTFIQQNVSVTKVADHG